MACAADTHRQKQTTNSSMRVTDHDPSVQFDTSNRLLPQALSVGRREDGGNPGRAGLGTTWSGLDAAVVPLAAR
jgi:hypothetical protein